MNIYFIGLGALGSLYASKIYDYNPSFVKIITDERRKEKLEKEGFYVNQKSYNFEYILPKDAANVPKADILFVCVKYLQLENSIPLFQDFIGEKTKVISILNGISSEKIIGEKIGMEHMLYAYGVGMDAFREGNKVRFSQEGTLVFGEKTNDEIPASIATFVTLLQKANIQFKIPEDMEHALWKKFILNIAANQISATLRLNYGNIKHNEFAQKLMRMAAAEVIDIANKKEIHFDKADELEHLIDNIQKLADENTTSMCQDILAHRYTEVDMFAGEVIRQGIENNIPTPVNELLYLEIKAIEKTF
ncbi:ketopantoate reductase family protein [Rhizosphaericola mali]|uniref:2-dehydropantoate 2-reductase n=1 Tax=Rhizosphaericola mali TaxID=2545455 RepID=A0A5P2G468_9BACT|nr:ketopantoate reductase family protein [Rhizosphaericola mali]QES90626.1 ketopantoate reductase family protein [Rhizosphaericola mali]